ncbi:MAG TPA: hypothetical protein VFK37_07320 [Bacillales bacterium]|nr:hypothetical protein [Bacillales bacterium]HEU5139377.1 hypothetical protein [Bacillales bacterium]
MTNQEERNHEQEMKVTNHKETEPPDVAESKRRKWEQEQKEKREHQS